MAGAAPHKWEFKARFRRNAFGWRSQPALARIKEALAEIKKVAKRDALLGGEGAVLWLERISPALAQVDSSSGSIGTAVNHAIDVLVSLISAAPASEQQRRAWLERLYQALEDDCVPYIEALGEHWGALCAAQELASEWADRLLPLTRRALSSNRTEFFYFKGAAACLSALYYAGRYDELIITVERPSLWDDQKWVARALAARGETEAALEFAEQCRGRFGGSPLIDRECEALLLAQGQVEAAYARYGVRANQRDTYLATFRALAKKYPHKAPRELLSDLVASTPGEEGRWFAAAKDARLYDTALALAERGPCDPMTLARAARNHLGKVPEFALRAGLLALHWMCQGRGYELTGAHVIEAYSFTRLAAEELGRLEDLPVALKTVLSIGGPGQAFVQRNLPANATQ
ncbi:MAG: hypothetical protein R3F49_06820 [Planctomycetota bacterium]